MQKQCSSALVLGADILQSTNLLLTHSRHHRDDQILPLIKPIFNLCLAKQGSKWPNSLPRGSCWQPNMIQSSNLGKQSFISRELKIILGASTFSQQADLHYVLTMYRVKKSIRADFHQWLEESKEAYKSILRYVNQLVVGTVDMGNLHGTIKDGQTHYIVRTKQTTLNMVYTYITVMRRGHNILKLLSIENVNGHEVTFGMPMLPCLGSWNLNNLQ